MPRISHHSVRISFRRGTETSTRGRVRSPIWNPFYPRNPLLQDLLQSGSAILRILWWQASRLRHFKASPPQTAASTEEVRLSRPGWATLPVYLAEQWDLRFAVHPGAEWSPASDPVEARRA